MLLWSPFVGMTQPPHGALLRVNEAHPLGRYLEYFVLRDATEGAHRYPPPVVSGSRHGDGVATTMGTERDYLVYRNETTAAPANYLQGPTLRESTSFTICARLFFVNSPAGRSHAIASHDSDVTRGHYFTVVTFSGSQRLLFFTNGGSFNAGSWGGAANASTNVFASVTLPDGAFANVAAVRDGTGAALVQNGVYVNDYPAAWVAPNTKTEPWYFGRRAYPSFEDGFYGGMQYLALFHKPLPLNEINRFQANPWGILTC